MSDVPAPAEHVSGASGHKCPACNASGWCRPLLAEQPTHPSVARDILCQRCHGTGRVRVADAERLLAMYASINPPYSAPPLKAPHRHRSRRAALPRHLRFATRYPVPRHGPQRHPRDPPYQGRMPPLRTRAPILQRPPPLLSAFPAPLSENPQCSGRSLSLRRPATIPRRSTAPASDCPSTTRARRASRPRPNGSGAGVS